MHMIADVHGTELRPIKNTKIQPPPPRHAIPEERRRLSFVIVH